VIAFDLVSRGLAISLMFGVAASTRADAAGNPAIKVWLREVGWCSRDEHKP
jgi:hypothetical protein